MLGWILRRYSRNPNCVWFSPHRLLQQDLAYPSRDPSWCMIPCAASSIEIRHSPTPREAHECGIRWMCILRGKETQKGAQSQGVSRISLPLNATEILLLHHLAAPFTAANYRCFDSFWNDCTWGDAHLQPAKSPLTWVSSSLSLFSQTIAFCTLSYCWFVIHPLGGGAPAVWISHSVSLI